MNKENICHIKSTQIINTKLYYVFHRNAYIYTALYLG